VKRVSPRVAAEDLVSALDAGRSLQVRGAQGSLRGFLLAQVALHTERRTPVVFVAADDAQASVVARDCAFFLGCPPPSETDLDGPIVLVPEFDVSPYADVSPDARGVAARLAALARLLEGQPPSVVILTVRSLMRRAIAPDAYRRHSTTWSVGEEIERDQAMTTLLASGYGRVDVVEDPGTFAVRGGVMDVFVPRLRFPVRIEWFGDEIERMRLFDAESQRSQRNIEAVCVHPVRETIATTSEPLRVRVLRLADALQVPSSRSRQVCENLERGLDFFGIDALAPVFRDAMVPLWSYLPGAHWLVEDADALLALVEH